MYMDTFGNVILFTLCFGILSTLKLHFGSVKMKLFEKYPPLCGQILWLCILGLCILHQPVLVLEVG